MDSILSLVPTTGHRGGRTDEPLGCFIGTCYGVGCTVVPTDLAQVSTPVPREGVELPHIIAPLTVGQERTDETMALLRCAPQQ